MEKTPGAGSVTEVDGYRCQTMHNGARVLEHCYYGRWMTELIRLLHGHHEPQEEKAFYEILKQVKPRSTMVELGSFWSYYSLWFQRAVVGATNIMVEPDPNNLAVGQKNFELNHSLGEFIHASAGRTSTPSQPFTCESDGMTREIECISVDELVRREKLDQVEILLVDTQGLSMTCFKARCRP